MKFENVNLTDYFDIVGPGVEPFKGTKKYIATGSLETGRIVSFEEVDYDSRPSRANMEVKENDIMFAKMKDTEKMFCVSKEDTEHLYSTGFSIIRIKDAKQFYPKFVFYWVMSNEFQDKKNKECTGATQKALNETKLRKFRVPKPPYETQKKIATMLEKAEKLKSFRTDADKLTDEFLKSMFYEMFGDPVTNPKRWEKKKLGDFGEIKTGNTPSRKKPDYYGDYIEWIKSDNLNTPQTYLTKSKEMLSKEGASIGRLAPKRSVLVTCIAGSLNCIGNAGVADREVAFNQQINAIIPKKDVDEFFLYYLIQNTKQHIQNYSTKAMKGMISKSTFKEIPSIYPPFVYQKKFGDIAKAVNQLMTVQANSKQSIDDLFNALMQKAFKGEVL